MARRFTAWMCGNGGENGNETPLAPKPAVQRLFPPDASLFYRVTSLPNDVKTLKNSPEEHLEDIVETVVLLQAQLGDIILEKDYYKSLADRASFCTFHEVDNYCENCDRRAEVSCKKKLSSRQRRAESELELERARTAELEAEKLKLKRQVKQLQIDAEQLHEENDAWQAKFDREKECGERDESGKLLSESFRFKMESERNDELRRQRDEERVLSFKAQTATMHIKMQMETLDNTTRRLRRDDGLARSQIKQLNADLRNAKKDRDDQVAEAQRDRDEKIAEAKRDCDVKVAETKKDCNEKIKGMQTGAHHPTSVVDSPPIPSPTSPVASITAVKRQRVRFVSDILAAYGKAPKTGGGPGTTPDDKHASQPSSLCRLRDKAKLNCLKRQRSGEPPGDFMVVDSMG